MIDAPRALLMILNASPGVTVGEARRHCQLAGADISCWPEWALTEEKQHLTKAGQAILIWHMMEAARLRAQGEETLGVHSRCALELAGLRAKPWTQEEYTRECWSLVTDFLGDIGKASTWFTSENYPLLGGMKPADMIEMGRADRLYRVICEALDEGWVP